MELNKDFGILQQHDTVLCVFLFDVSHV